VTLARNEPSPPQQTNKGTKGTPEMSTASYTVVGMTCGHCVNSVTEEVSQVPGVTDVNVDLATGGLTVTSVADVDDGAVRAAVEEAGYQVAGA
jgi:copper chaperone CopZ